MCAPACVLPAPHVEAGLCKPTGFVHGARLLLFVFACLECQPYTRAHNWPSLRPLCVCALAQRCAVSLQEMGMPHQVLHARLGASACLRILD